MHPKSLLVHQGAAVAALPASALWRRLKSKLLRASFHAYYWVKAGLLEFVVGKEALASVLYNSLLPEIVLRLGGATVGENVRIGRWLTVHASEGSFENLRIGNDVFIGKHVTLDLTGRVTIGDRCAIGANVMMITHRNFGDSSLAEAYPASQADVEIVDDAVIGWGCLLLKGTTIGKAAIVLPGAVVSGAVKEGTTCGGNPARPVPRAAPNAPALV